MPETNGNLMVFEALIEPMALHARLGDSNWVVVDCRFNLLDPEAGRRAYRQGHIPGAYYAHLEEDLSGPVTPDSGRHPLPAAQHLAHTLGKWGIRETSQVVVYDDAGGAIAARLWWLLRWLGHRACAVLNGGLPAWKGQNLPLSTAMPEHHIGVFPERHNDDLWVDSATVLATVVQGDALLLDARANARYRGEQEPIDPVAGHIPNAVNLPLEGNLTREGRFLEPAALRSRFAAVLGERAPAQVLHMCGSGVTACHNLLAMEVAGLQGARLYVGSWSEWIRNPDRPVVTGAF
jgi:thiosulfate/3-mercaptopyruvate sulfurtransferase